jgi:hypothetical protein
MKNASILFFVSTLFLLSSCKSEVDPIIEDFKPTIEIVDADGFMGTWEWEGSHLGITGKIITPDSVGYTQQISLKSDGTVIRYKDYEITDERTYLLKDTTNSRYGMRTMIAYDGGSFGYCQQISLDSLGATLSFGGNCPDWGGEWYTRIE